VRFNKMVFSTGQSYFLVLTDNALRRKTARGFADWLVSEARERHETMSYP
jgi:hypothetical protein